MKLLNNYSLKKLTTMAMGGAARYYVAVRSEGELLEALEYARTHKLAYYVIGEGSNLIAADKGFSGLVIRNQIVKFNRERRLISVGAGSNLTKFILKLDRLGLSGLEKMAGIPGTVGGAVYGSAGAYGQEIKDRIVGVDFFDGKRFRSLPKASCKFSYRASIFKQHKNWIITGVRLELGAGESESLLRTSNEIIKLREKKYWPGLKCPGSFFKNIKLSEISSNARKRILSIIPKEKILYGKLPAGVLLEEVGAKGIHQGTIRVADHHANLIYNPGGGKAADVKKLAQNLRKLVKTRFGVIIEEEVQYLDF